MMMQWIKLLCVDSILPIYIFIPGLFIPGLFIANNYSSISKFDRTKALLAKHGSLLTIATIFNILILVLLILFLIVQEFALGLIEEMFMRYDVHLHYSFLHGSFYANSFTIAVLSTQLLLPITTFLMLLTWYSSTSINRRNVAFLVVATWFILRIGLIIAFLNYTDPDVQAHPAARTVFGSFMGLWVCSVLSGGSALVSGLVMQKLSPTLRFLTIAVCLCPLLVLIWGSMEISLGWYSIDLMATAFILGWLLSVLSRPTSASGNVKSAARSGRSSDVGEKFGARNIGWIEGPPTIVPVSPAPWRWLVAGGFVLIAAFPGIIFYRALDNFIGFTVGSVIGSWVTIWAVAAGLGALAFAAAPRYEYWGANVRWLIVGGFVLIVIVPAIVLKWAFHDLFGFRLDGAAEAWATIWAVALGLGMLSFTVASRYEHQYRAVQLAIAAFLCAFAIMIFNWVPLSDYRPMAHINGVGTLFTTPIVALGTLALIATVVLDKLRWTWPFWACYLFIYIFVHSMAGNGYVKDLSKLDLFSWINMSVIMFVFLFAIPAYFASERCQVRRLVATPHELSG